MRLHIGLDYMQPSGERVTSIQRLNSSNEATMVVTFYGERMTDVSAINSQVHDKADFIQAARELIKATPQP